MLKRYSAKIYPRRNTWDIRPRPPRKSVRKERGLSAKSHSFHLLLTFCTCGVWGLLVWLPLWIYRLIVRRRIVTKHHY